ncbi:glycosyltransferase family 1 protein [Paraburkholderia sp. CNPSo 3076]|uniref:glycosyltransferase family 4 protein n=1 Tax=Paraburkholderia sp. CNPSo 3076 TaxID=2940936 RepID=UPI00225C3372|nr:glycosyltransferase family 1 protein [Paraburkholderia sp. CNPSo 3076]MCX5539972.1 glycosyltransferase family 1 protein [Paraburkholderia sp. CNPSo 3076]
MRIAIDLQSAQCESRFRGIGRYSLSLACAMVREAASRGHELYIVLNGKFPETIPVLRNAFTGLIGQDRILVFTCPPNTSGMTDGGGWRSRAAQLVREEFFGNLQPDVIHLSSLFEGWGDEANTGIGSGLRNLPTAVTLYDLIPHVMSDIYLADPGYREFYMSKLAALKRSDFMLAISDYSRREAIAELDIPEEHVVSISAAISSDFAPVTLDAESANQLLAKYDITSPFVLYVPGGFDPRKNFDRLIDAYAALPAQLRANLQLVIGSKLPDGMRQVLTDKAASAGLTERELRLTDYLSEDDLVALYGLCRLSVFPSLYEGFGLPALEAMACGAPVIASQTSSLPEVIGREDALFDPLSVPDMTRELMRALTDKQFLAGLRKHCLEFAKNFSWERSAVLALDGLEAAFGGKTKARSTCDAVIEGDRYETIQTHLQQNSPATPQASDKAFVRSSLDANNKVVRRVNGERQLFVDISELVMRDAKSGIQRVVRSILLQLLKHPPRGYRVEPVYTPDGLGLQYANKFIARYLGEPDEHVQDVPVTFGAGDVFVGLDLTAHLFPAINETLWHMRMTGVQIHYVVYDLTPLMDTRWHSVGMTTAFTHWIDGLSNAADSLLCISEAVALDVSRWYAEQRQGLGRVPAIRHFHLGADIGSSAPTWGVPVDATAVLAALRSRPSFLMVGTIEPRKGYAQVLDAFDALWAKNADVHLVIVGKAGWHMETIIERILQHPKLGRDLFWLEGISDEYLEQVYGASSALIAASEYEGFGLPLIEAAQHHLPIIARDIPVFREVAGQHAYWFNGLDGSKLVEALEAWLDLLREGSVPESGGMPWLTWSQSTAQLLEQIGLRADSPEASNSACPDSIPSR